MCANTTNLPFIVGVTGNMDLREDEIPRLTELLERIFRFLKNGKGGDQIDFEELLKEMSPQSDRRLMSPFHKVFASWQGLENTEILVLSSLAPGADTLVAKIALDMRHSVKAPLPFPWDIYDQASTFVFTEPGASPERQKQLDDENRKRQDVYNKLLERVKPKNTFAVRLARDQQRRPSDQGPDYRNELQNQQARHERYYAAGEYIARYSHLLLAIWDNAFDNDTSVGTAAVVEARRFGPRARLLEGNVGVGLPPGGPILHLYTQRKKNSGEKRGGPSMRFLLPAALSLPMLAEKPADQAKGLHEVELESLGLLRSISENLDEFNSTREAAEADIGREVHNRFPYDEVRNQLQAEQTEMFQELERQLALRRRAADRGGELEKKHNRSLAVLFWLTFLAAAAFHVFAHWETEEEGEVTHPSIIRVVSGGASLLLTLAGLVYFGLRKPLRYAERGNDYRALAEAMRVQFHWNLAGLGRSVPANYVHRQRSELDWIRAAVRAASFPYHRFQDWFAHLDPEIQKGVLKCVQKSWLVEQVNYFATSTTRNRELLHFFHKIAAWFALTGIAVLAGAYLCVVGLTEWFEHWNVWLMLVGAVILTFWWLVGWRRRHFKSKFEWRRKDEKWRTFLERAALWFVDSKDTFEPRRKAETRWNFLVRMAKWFVMWSVERITPARESHSSQLGKYPQRLAVLVGRFLLILIPSLLLAEFLLGLVHLPRWRSGVPAPENVAIIIGGILLLGGALLVAWAEKSLYSEHAYQYSTMQMLFNSSQLRMERARAELETKTAGSPEYRKLLGEIQDFLYALGREALDENAEWLILHRSRPLEPVMAG